MSFLKKKGAPSDFGRLLDVVVVVVVGAVVKFRVGFASLSFLWQVSFLDFGGFPFSQNGIF